jgi:hypothetical protein
MKYLNILLIFLIISAAIIPALGDIPSHINPENATISNSNLQAQQLWLINELLSYRSGVYISLNKGDIKGAMENLDSYQKIFQENNNILIGIGEDVYAELNKSANTLNLTTDQIKQLLPLYEEGRLAYQNNQIQNATLIALKSRTIIGNLTSLQQELIMGAVAQYPGVNTTLYLNGSSSFNSTLKEIQKRWQAVEITLFDETETLLSISPSEGEFGEAILIKGNLTMPRNGSGIPNASMEIQIESEVIKTKTDRIGKYNFTYKIPYKKSGVYPLQVNFVPVTEPLIASSAKSSFLIKPTNTTLTINAAPDYGKFGEIIHLSGRLVAKNSSSVDDADILIGFDNKTNIIRTKTDKNGFYESNFTITAMAQGKHVVNAEFIPSDQPLFRSGNETTITLMPTATILVVSGQNITFVQDYLNISGQLLTDNKLDVPDARVSVFFDKNEVGTAIVNSSNFFFSYWINKNTSSGNHTVTVKFNGYSPFLPSENSISLEIKNKPLISRNIIFLALAVGIISIFYIRREKALKLLNGVFASKDKKSIDTRIKTETPSATQEPLKEPEIEPQEPAVQVQEYDMLNKVYAHPENLIEHKQFKESISLSYKNAKDHISISSGVKNTPQQTHWEFYNLVKSSSSVVADDLQKLTELYETAMYSNVKIDAAHAEKAVELFKKIYKLNNEKNK